MFNRIHRMLCVVDHMITRQAMELREPSFSIMMTGAVVAQSQIPGLHDFGNVITVLGFLSSCIDIDSDGSGGIC